MASGQLVGLDLDPTTAFDASLAINEIAFRYVDMVSEQVMADYADERAALTRHDTVRRMHAVRAVLDGDPVRADELERVLDYRLGPCHVGAVLWVSETVPGDDPGAALDRTVQRIAARRDQPTLVVARDEASLMVWVTVADHAPAWSQDEWQAELDPTVCVAMGLPGPRPGRIPRHHAPGGRGVRHRGGSTHAARTRRPVRHRGAHRIAGPRS